MKFILNDINIFGSTLCYYDFGNYDILSLQKKIPLRMQLVKCCVYHSKKIKLKNNFNEKCCTTNKQGVLSNLYKIIGVHLHKDTIMNQLHIHGLYNWSY